MKCTKLAYWIYVGAERMPDLPFRSVIIATSLILIAWQPIVVGDEENERAERIRAAKEFLSPSRIAKWEKVFTEGVWKMGRIVAKLNGKVVLEGWFEKDYMLLRFFKTNNRVERYISNPDYFAVVRTRGNEHRLYGVYPSVSKSPLVYTDGMPFANNSSVNVRRELIPTFLMQGKLAIHDYRTDGSRHIVELEFTEKADTESNPNGGLIELVFDDDISPLLPVETTFGKGTPYARHIISSDFREVAGYLIPHRCQEMLHQEFYDCTIEFFPEDRLDPAMCRLSYYGLPEPGDLNFTDFGRKQTPWLTVVSIILAATVASAVVYILVRRRFARD